MRFSRPAHLAAGIRHRITGIRAHPRTTEGVAEVDAGHLTPEDIAAYLARRVTGTDRDEMERHMVVCDACRHDLVHASQVPSRSRARRWVVVSLPVAAAAVIAALLLLPSPTSPPLPGTPASALRGDGFEPMLPFVALEPAQGAIAEPQGILFRWRSAGPDPFYRITVIDERGDVVWSATSADTVILLPDSISLGGRQTYFWYVDALLRGARSSSTGIQEFATKR